MNNKEWKKWIFWFSFAVASIIVYKTIDSVGIILLGISNFIDLLMPFIIAIIISYILYIPCKKIENDIQKSKFKILSDHSRGISVFSVYVIVMILIFIAFRFIMPALSTSVKDLTENLPNYYNRAVEYLNNVEEDSLLAKLNLKDYVKNFEELNLGEEISKIVSLENISSYIKGIMGAANVVFDVFVTIVVSIYILLERSQIKEFLIKFVKALLDKKGNMVLARYYKKTNSIFFSFVSAQILDAFIIGIITSIAMVVMKIKYAVLLGFMIGLFNIIPYFGAIVAIVISILITIFTGGIFQAIWLGVVVIILQQIDANIINPRILGNSLNLSPILVIFSVTVGGTYFGILGMFLGVPAIALVKIILEDFIEYKNKEGFFEKIHF